MFKINSLCHEKVERFGSLILMGQILLVCSGENRLKSHCISLFHSFIAELPNWLFLPTVGQKQRYHH